MSADNCIAILKTTDRFEKKNAYLWQNVGEIVAYRVAHIQAMDNFEWYKKEEPHNLGYWFHSLWGRSEVFYEKDQAFDVAKKLYSNEDFVEYGIQLIDASEFSFPCP